MFRRLVLAGFMAVTLLAFPAASASAGSAAAASRPQPVSIVSTMTMADPYNYGTFSAAGSHLICRSGTVNDTQYIWGPPTWFSNGDALITLDVDKTFTCRDGGQILVQFTAHQYYHDPAANNYIPTAEAFKWVVAGGTGAYARLQGQGLGVTKFSVVDDQLVSATNYYWGSLVG